jgi:hypothetical protein
MHVLLQVSVGIRDKKQRSSKRITHHADDLLDDTNEDTARRVETFGPEELPEDVLVRFLQNAHIRVRARFVEPLPDECPFRVFQRKLARAFNLAQDVDQVGNVIEG